MRVVDRGDVDQHRAPCRCRPARALATARRAIVQRVVQRYARRRRIAGVGIGDVIDDVIDQRRCRRCGRAGEVDRQHATRTGEGGKGLSSHLQIAAADRERTTRGERKGIRGIGRGALHGEAGAAIVAAAAILSVEIDVGDRHRAQKRFRRLFRGADCRGRSRNDRRVVDRRDAGGQRRWGVAILGLAAIGADIDQRPRGDGSAGIVDHIGRQGWNRTVEIGGRHEADQRSRRKHQRIGLAGRTDRDPGTIEILPHALRCHGIAGDSDAGHGIAVGIAVVRTEQRRDCLAGRRRGIFVDRRQGSRTRNRRRIVGCCDRYAQRHGRAVRRRAARNRQVRRASGGHRPRRVVDHMNGQRRWRAGKIGGGNEPHRRSGAKDEGTARRDGRHVTPEAAGVILVDALCRRGCVAGYGDAGETIGRRAARNLILDVREMAGEQR